MKKLRKYIQECWGDIVYSDYNKVATLEDLEYNYRYIRFILSHEAMFIKWLVDNDKIDRDKKEIEKSDYDITFTWALTMDKKSDLDIMVDTLLMLLSISDTPIDDLISYLK